MLHISRIEVPPERFDVPLDAADLFDRPGPVEVEIGCGKGGFLLQQARAYPDHNFLGIEWARKYATHAADRMARWGVTNVRIVRIDARAAFLASLLDQCLSGLHTYHPDPWPKRRHARRRLFQPDFVRAAVRTLKAGAHWAIQTDHATYFEQIRALLTSHPELEPVARGISDSNMGAARVETNYEIKYVRQGRTIYRLLVRRRLSSQVIAQQDDTRFSSLERMPP